MSFSLGFTNILNFSIAVARFKVGLLARIMNKMKFGLQRENYTKDDDVLNRVYWIINKYNINTNNRIKPLPIIRGKRHIK